MAFYWFMLVYHCSRGWEIHVNFWKCICVFGHVFKKVCEMSCFFPWISLVPTPVLCKSAVSNGLMPLLLMSVNCLRKVEKPRGPLSTDFLSPQRDSETTYTGLVQCEMCLFTPQFLLVLIALTHVGMARLSLPGWLVTYQDGLPNNGWWPMQVLTRPDIE